MTKALQIDASAHGGLIAEARDALHRAAAMLIEANCPGAASLATAAARKASKAVRRKKTLLLDTFSGRD